ncbi:hypothetical protein D3C73_1375970 [compost metagenome]
MIEDLFGQLSARANADEVSISDLFLELGFRQRTCEVLDAGVARRLEDVDSRLVDAFEKKELDLALIERSLAHLRKPVSRRKMAGNGQQTLTRTTRMPSPQNSRWALCCGVGMLAYAPR